MYSENNRRASGMRANDEFLRRMLGGDLTGGEVPAMSKDPMEQNYSLERDGDDGHRGGSMGERGNARLSNEPNGGLGGGYPSCDGSVGNGVSNGKPSRGDGECPTCISVPSLAMVYAPRQCWRNLLDLQSALDHGTLFAELVLPFEGGSRKTGREGYGKC